MSEEVKDPVETPGAESQDPALQPGPTDPGPQNSGILSNLGSVVGEAAQAVAARVQKLRKDVPAKLGEYIPLLATVVDDHDSGNVVLEIGGEHFRLSQARIAEYRADAEYPHNEDPGA